MRPLLFSLALCLLVLGLAAPASAIPAKPMGEVAAGIGLGNYNQDLGRVTNDGFAWAGRFGAMVNPIFGGEFSYQGFSSSFIDTQLPNGVFVNDVIAVQQAISFNGKAGLPVPVSVHQLYLYGLIGAGYSNISVSQGGFVVGTDSDSAFLVPFGGGASFIFRNGFLVDGRFTYNLLSGDRSRVVQSGDSWTLGVNLGARFGI